MTWHINDEGAGEVITPSHEAIHEGKHFFFAGFAMLDTGEYHRVKFLTSDSDDLAHFEWNVSSSGVAELYLYEGAADGMLGGTSITPLNSNRASAGTSPLTITNGVTAASSNGTLLESAAWGASGAIVRLGGGASRDDELVLKKSTTYLGVLFSSAATNRIQFKASWYEKELS